MVPPVDPVVDGGPTADDLLRHAPPELHRNGAQEMLHDGGFVRNTDTLAQSAENEQSVGVKPAVAAPNQWGVVDVSPRQGLKVSAKRCKISTYSAFRVILASLLRVRKHMSSAIMELPKAVVETSAGRKSVPGIRPHTSVSAEGSHISAAWCTNLQTA